MCLQSLLLFIYNETKNNKLFIRQHLLVIFIEKLQIKSNRNGPKHSVVEGCGLWLITLQKM